MSVKMSISSNVEMSAASAHEKDEVQSVSDEKTDKSRASDQSSSSSSSCLLCGSCEDCSYEIETSNRVKWTLHFCQLFRIDECPFVPQTTKAEMWTTMQNSLYCVDCIDILERISHLLQTIEDINAQLRVIQLQCEAKLEASKQSFQDPHEVNRRRSLWTCMRMGEATGGGRDLDRDLTELELPSTSRDNENVDLVRERTESGSNSPASPFSPSDIDYDSTFDSVKQEPLDTFCSSLSPMPILPIEVIQEQSDLIKVEPADTPSGSESLELDVEVQEKTEENTHGPGVKRLTEVPTVTSEKNELLSKKSKTHKPKRKNQKQLRERCRLKTVNKQDGICKSRKQERENKIEYESKDNYESTDFRSSSSSSSSYIATAASNKYRTRKPRRIRRIESSSSSESENEKKKEQKTMKPRRQDQVSTATKVKVKRRCQRWEGRLPCPFAPECNRIFHTTSRRNEHVVLVHEGKKFTCEICGRSYGLQKLLDDHGNTHKGLTPFKCTICPKEFAMSLQLSTHKRNAHSARPLKCTPCGKKFSNDANYQKHLSSATHLLRTRPKVLEKRSTPRVCPPRKQPETGPHKCPFPTCDKAYTARYNLRKHLRIHDDVGRASLTCKFCQRTYASESGLKQHEALLHTGEAKFRCEQCPFLGMSKSSLQKHVNTVHSEERPLQCDICGHTFKHKTYLGSHKQMYHPTTKNHMCSVCGKCFSNKRYLQAHEETHKEFKSFLCSHCGRGFSHKASLNVHLRSVHKVPRGGPAPKVKVTSAGSSVDSGNQQVQGHNLYTNSESPPDLLSFNTPSFPPF